MELSVASNQAIPCIPNTKKSRYLYVFLPNFVDRTKWPPPPRGLRPASNRLSALFRTVHKKRERDISMLAVASPICASACRHRRADAGGVRRRNYQPQHFGDAPMLPELLDQIPSDREIGSVTPDGAYDTRKGHDAIAGRGADAVIPTRKNAKPWTPDTVGARARNDILRATKHLGRARWRRGNGCHRRSRAETKMNCFKLLGQRLMARDFDRQVAEIQIRIAGLNRYTTLAIPITKPVA